MDYHYDFRGLIVAGSSIFSNGIDNEDDQKMDDGHEEGKNEESILKTPPLS